MKTISLVLEELRVRRRAILGWAIGLSLFTSVYMSFFPRLPDELTGLDFQTEIFQSIGVVSLANFKGFMQSTVLNFLPLFVSVFGIVLGVGALAGEEEEGTLELLASQPISRLQLYTAKAAAMILAALLALLTVAVVVVAVFLTLESQVDTAVTAADLFWVMLATWPCAFIFISLSLFLGAFLPTRGNTMAVAVAVLVGTFFGDNLAGMVTGLERLQPLFPFYYFARVTEMLAGEVPWEDILILLAMAVVPLVLGAVGFQFRDVTLGAWPWQQPRFSARGPDGTRRSISSGRTAVPLAIATMAAAGCLAVAAIALVASDDLRADVRERLGIDDEDVITASGELMDSEFDVEAGASGTVVAVHGTAGDTVAESDVLVELADETWPTLAVDAREVVDQTWVLVTEYYTGLSRPGDTTASLEDAVDKTADAARSADRALSDAQSSGDRTVPIELLEAQADVAAARLRVAIARLALAEDRLSVDDVQAVVAAVGKVKPLSERDYSPELNSVRAGVAGTVTAVLVGLDDYVSPGQTVARMALPDLLTLLIRISDDDADGIEVGDSVEIDVDDFEDPFEGEVVEMFEVEPTTEGDGADDGDGEGLTYGVRITVDNPKGLLEAGMRAEVRIEPR